MKKIVLIIGTLVSMSVFANSGFVNGEAVLDQIENLVSINGKFGKYMPVNFAGRRDFCIIEYVDYGGSFTFKYLHISNSPLIDDEFTFTLKRDLSHYQVSENDNSIKITSFYKNSDQSSSDGNLTISLLDSLASGHNLVNFEFVNREGFVRVCAIKTKPE